MTESARAQAQGNRRVAGAHGARPGGGDLSAIVLALLVALVPLAAPAQDRAETDMRALLVEQPFPYEAKDVTLTEMLHDLSHKTGVPVVVGDGVSGRVDIANLGGSVRTLLDALTDQGRISWWFDGAAVHVEQPQMASRLLPLNGVRVEDLRAALRAVGMTAGEYPMIAEPGSRLVRIVAPQGYVEMVEQTIAALAAEAKAKEAPALLPIIIRGPGRARPARLRSPAGVAPAAPSAAPFAPATASGGAPAQAAPFPSYPTMEQR